VPFNAGVQLPPRSVLLGNARAVLSTSAWMARMKDRF